MTPVIVIATLQIGTVILSEATLSFLGIGIPITEPSLGLLVAQGYNVLFSALVGICISGTRADAFGRRHEPARRFSADEFNPRLK